MIRIQSEDFDAGAELKAMTEGRTDIGAVVSFVGLVRDLAGNANISSMTLEHYSGMAERQAADLEAEARKRWPIQDCLIIHRYGTLNPGDQIVLVLVASAHRGAAFEAAEFLIDWLKTKAPFWKREATSDGDAWVNAKEDDDKAADRWAQKS